MRNIEAQLSLIWPCNLGARMISKIPTDPVRVSSGGGQRRYIDGDLPPLSNCMSSFLIVTIRAPQQDISQFFFFFEEISSSGCSRARSLDRVCTATYLFGLQAPMVVSDLTPIRLLALNGPCMVHKVFFHLKKSIVETEDFDSDIQMS